MKHRSIASVLLALPLALAALTAAAQSTEGEVKKLDKERGTITIKAGEIKSLDMPPMTMTFRVADPKLLDAVAAGDKVRFDAAKVDGRYTVTAITRAP